MAITNIHHRSRSAVLATSATAPPAWVRSVGVAGRHSGEYVSTATTPRSGPPGVVYAYTPGGNSSSARPVASKRNVSVRVVPPAVNVTARSRGDPEPVQRHASGMPFDTSYVSGATRSLLPAPSASSQSVNAATSARYASALAPPRNAQRNSPAAATVAWRALRQRRSPPAGSDSTNARTGTRATSLRVRARKRLSQSGGEASSTTEGGGLTSSTNTRASSRGSESPATPSSRTSRACQPAREEPREGDRGRVISVETVPLSGSATARDTKRRPASYKASVPFPLPLAPALSPAAFPAVP